jgi:hypothetical protein
MTSIFIQLQSLLESNLLDFFSKETSTLVEAENYDVIFKRRNLNACVSQASLI